MKATYIVEEIKDKYVLSVCINKLKTDNFVDLILYDTQPSDDRVNEDIKLVNKAFKLYHDNITLPEFNLESIVYLTKDQF
jgi:hypothetical protein